MKRAPCVFRICLTSSRVSSFLTSTPIIVEPSDTALRYCLKYSVSLPPVSISEVSIFAKNPLFPVAASSLSASVSSVRRRISSGEKSAPVQSFDNDLCLFWALNDRQDRIVWHWQRFLIVEFVCRFHDIDESMPTESVFHQDYSWNTRPPCKSREELVPV